MEEQNSIADSPDASPFNREPGGLWASRWMRIGLFVAYLALLVTALTLTPEDYAFQLGASIGPVVIFGTIFLPILLWFSRTRTLVWLFCGLAVAQTGCITLVALNFRAENRVIRRVRTEGAHRRDEATRQLADFHLERIFEMLAPGNEFHSAELPGLLERVRAARVKGRVLEAEHKAWLKEAEKDVAAVSRGAAHEFRRGIDSTADRDAKVQKSVEDYVNGLETLITFLIEREGSYRITGGKATFNGQPDADRYNQIIAGLTALREQFMDDGSRPPRLRRTPKTDN